MVAIRLKATMDAPRLARDAIEEVPGLAELEDLRFVAALLTTELMSNAVRHACLTRDDEVALCVETDGETVYVEVADTGSGFFPLPHAQPRGRARVEHGLHLIDVLADRWGFRCHPAGCVVWFEVDLVPGRRAWRGRVPVSRSTDPGAGTR